MAPDPDCVTHFMKFIQQSKARMRYPWNFDQGGEAGEAMGSDFALENLTHVERTLTADELPALPDVCLCQTSDQLLSPWAPPLVRQVCGLRGGTMLSTTSTSSYQHWRWWRRWRWRT